MRGGAERRSRPFCVGGNEVAGGGECSLSVTKMVLCEVGLGLERTWYVKTALRTDPAALHHCSLPVSSESLTSVVVAQTNNTIVAAVGSLSKGETPPSCAHTPRTYRSKSIISSQCSPGETPKAKRLGANQMCKKRLFMIQQLRRRVANRQSKLPTTKERRHNNDSSINQTTAGALLSASTRAQCELKAGARQEWCLKRART